jgi:hypothetical protein
MGQLKSGAVYVYERVDGVTYAREIGADPSTRQAIGWDYDPINGHKIDYDKRTADGRSLHKHMREDQLWGNIRRAAKDNPALQEALERAIIIYYLSQDDPNNTTMYHPV